MVDMDVRDTSAAAEKSRWLVGVVLICASIALLEGYDIQALGIAAPKLLPALHISPALAGIVFGGGMAGFVMGSMAGGWLSDRAGRRLVLAVAVIAFGAGTLVTPFVLDYWGLLAARIATGLGLGAAVVNIILIAYQVFSERWRTFIVSAMMAGMPLGGATVSAFAAAYMDRLGWQSLFYVGGLVPIALVPLFAILPAAPGRAQFTKDISDAPERTSLLAALFADGRALTTLLLWTTFGLTITVLYVLLNWLPTLVVNLGLSSVTASLCTMALNLASVAGTLISGLAMNRIGFRRVAPLFFICLVAAVFALSHSTSEHPLLIASAAVGFFILGGIYGLYGVVPSFYPVANRGFATGISIGVGRVGSIVGPMLGGLFLSSPDSAALIGVSLLGMVAVAAAAVLLMSVTARQIQD